MKNFQTSDNMTRLVLPKVVLVDQPPLNEDCGHHVRFRSFLFTQW